MPPEFYMFGKLVPRSRWRDAILRVRRWWVLAVGGNRWVQGDPSVRYLRARWWPISAIVCRLRGHVVTGREVEYGGGSCLDCYCSRCFYAHVRFEETVPDFLRPQWEMLRMLRRGMVEGQS